MKAAIPGILRGLLRNGTPVTKGMKAGDVDPRGNKEYCYTHLRQGARHRGGRAGSYTRALSRHRRQPSKSTTSWPSTPVAPGLSLHRRPGYGGLRAQLRGRAGDRVFLRRHQLELAACNTPTSSSPSPTRTGNTSPISRRRCRGAASKGASAWWRGDSTSCPSRARAFDLVILRGAFFFIMDRPKILDQVARLLRPGGLAFVGGGYGKGVPQAVIDEIAGNRAY